MRGFPREARGPPPRFVRQPLDHFAKNTSTWAQAYYVNDTFFQPGSAAPVFLCVGGEGPPLDGSAVVSSVHCNVAVEWLPETGALMFAIEHRFYGCHNASACPVANLSVPGALETLTSRQALRDIANFVSYAKREYGLTSANRWVTFGGSYPGMLAGWARLLFPDLIFASVSSSAPVRAELDMKGYYNVVAEAYAVEHQRVGGSAACREAIAEGHRKIGELFEEASGRERLASLFGNDAAWYAAEANQREFAGWGVAEFPAQSNDPACTTAMCDIAKICAVMTNSSTGDEVDRLAHVRRGQMQGATAIELGSAPVREEPTPGYDNGAQLWGWQTCNEFGFYQTCERGTECFFTQGLVTLESEMSFCSSDFGMSRATVEANIAATNAYYGSDKPAGSRVFYVNGEVDPWHANSINRPLSSDMPALWVSGASHHFWTHPSLTSDQESVVAARLKIREQVLSFLSFNEAVTI